jgi:hypothetical protein
LKLTAAVFVAGLLARTSSIAQMKPAPPKPSLKESIAWMENFSSQHGFLVLGNGIPRQNSIRGVKGCVVSVDVTFRSKNSTSGSQVKKSTAEIVLTDFNPNGVREITDSDGTYEVNFERTDSSPAIEEHQEMADGRTIKVFVAELELFFDSEDSAKRFSRALSHVISLCGGTPAPF